MKNSLVLEGGGLRGAYTCGCLYWLVEHEIDFANAYAISSGSVYLSLFYLKKYELLKKVSTEILAGGKEFMGLKALMKEKHYVAYDYIFDEVLKNQLKVDFSELSKVKTKLNIGLYDLKASKTVYLTNDDINTTTLKAACSLPVISKPVAYQDGLYFDGGITDMIPISQSLFDNNERHLVICTKTSDYVRKPSSKIAKGLMNLIYRKFPKMAKDYGMRDKNYYQQMHLVDKLVSEHKAILIRPSQKLPVSRLKGSKHDLIEMFELGFLDMEANKKALYAMFK